VPEGPLEVPVGGLGLAASGEVASIPSAPRCEMTDPAARWFDGAAARPVGRRSPAATTAMRDPAGQPFLQRQQPARRGRRRPHVDVDQRRGSPAEVGRRHRGDGVDPDDDVRVRTDRLDAGQAPVEADLVGHLLDRHAAVVPPARQPGRPHARHSSGRREGRHDGPEG
jgi:hypothetical protein